MNLDKVIQIKCEAKSYYQLDELNHFQGKLKSIDKDRFDKLKKSLVSDGLPIGFHVWIDKKNKVWTIDGHHRVLALKALRDDGYDVPSLPCVIVQAKDKKEAAKAVLINNSKYAKINQESLSDFMIDFELNIDDLNFLDLPDLNMDDFGLDEKTKEGLTDDDAVPEVEQNIHGVTLGDIYQLGNHRLMCGDSTSIDAVEKLMDNQKADMVFTDPPYNTGMTSETQKGSGGLWKGNGSARLSHMFDDDYTPEEWDSFLDSFLDSFNKISKENSTLYICLDWRRSHELVPKAKKLFKFSNLIIWDKVVHGLGSDYKYTHEFIHVFKKGKPILNTHQGEDREYSDVWHIQRKMGKDEDHATKKPIEIIERAIRHASKTNDNVCDLFGGSGSTLIACEKTNRKCFMMELDPHYCSVIIERWQNFTGLKAKLITK